MGGVARLSEHWFGTLHISSYVVDKAESPWLAGGTTINLVVHKVTNADESSYESDGNAQAVEGPQHIFLSYMPAEDEDGNDDTNGAAMASESAFPHL